MASGTHSLPPLLGTVLVVGGCGFLGSRLVRDLLQDPQCGPVYVLDRTVKTSLEDGAVYLQGSITDVATVNSVLQTVKPRVIFHTASPNATFPTKGASDFYQTNVKGTEILLTSASEYSSVKAFVFTSSVDIYAQPPHEYVDESHALWTPDYSASEYSRTKAMADRYVCSANSSQLYTISLRLAHLYGDGCSQGVPATIDACSRNQRLFQIGDGKNLMEVVSLSNAVAAHILAAKALLDPSLTSGNVNGEAFNISDGAPVPFWRHVAHIWSVARGQPVYKDLTVIPTWIVWTIVLVVEWMYWIFTFGMKKPAGTMSRGVIFYAVYTHTYNIQKVRSLLGFQPVSDHDTVLRQAVELELQRRKMSTLTMQKGMLKES